jgi:MFS family permease
MYNNGSWQQLRENFADQFEPLGEDKYLYRRNQKSAPIEVTAVERARFIDQYGRRLRYSMWSMVAGLIVFMGAVVWWTVARNSDLPDLVLYIGIGLITTIAIGYLYWIRGAPARELERRGPVGRERSRDEMRALFFKKMGYGQLAGAAFAGLVLAFSRAGKEDLFHGWHRLWLVLAALLVLAAGVQAFRKWRFERENGDQPF